MQYPKTRKLIGTGSGKMMTISILASQQQGHNPRESRYTLAMVEELISSYYFGTVSLLKAISITHLISGFG